MPRTQIISCRLDADAIGCGNHSMSASVIPIRMEARTRQFVKVALLNVWLREAFEHGARHARASAPALGKIFEQALGLEPKGQYAVHAAVQRQGNSKDGIWTVARSTPANYLGGPIKS
jgi:hypothetical protein